MISNGGSEGPRDGRAKDRVDWETCMAAPTRACVLDEALIAARAEPFQEDAYDLYKIAEALGEIAKAQAASGNLQVALQIAHSIPFGKEILPGEERPRITALLAIADAQSRRGLVSDAKETLSQARRRACALRDRLERAEALLFVGEGESEAGMVTDAKATFQETQRLVEESLDIPITLESRNTFHRAEALLTCLAHWQATAGAIADSLRAARAIRYNIAGRAEAQSTVAMAQAKAGLRADAATTIKEALDAIDTWESWADVAEDRALDHALSADSAKFNAGLHGRRWIEALSWVARAQHAAGFTTASAATFERAMQSAAEIDHTGHRSTMFSRLGRVRYQDGRIAEATRAFDAALSAARSSKSSRWRTAQLMHVLMERLRAGFAADADAILTEIRDAMLQTVEESRPPYVWWLEIAWVQERMGRREEALATYRQALDAANAGSDKSQFTDLIWPGGLLQPRWLAESAPLVARMAYAIEDPLRRSSVLLALAQALPD
jgi:tetratricopeptide (TPR) repeat protein